LSSAGRRTGATEAAVSPEQRGQIERLFADHGPGVGSFLLSQVRDAELAEELTARVFLAVVRAFHQCSGSPAAWLWTIVRNELARHFRDRRPTATELPEPEDPSGPSDGPAHRREAEADMHAALARLAEDQQRILYLKFFQDMPNTDIAVALGLTATNVGVLVHRALRRLRDLLPSD